MPALRLSSTAAINKALLSKPLTSATATPRVHFQLDSPASPSGTDNVAPCSTVAQSKIPAEALSIHSSLPGDTDAPGTLGMLQSVCEMQSKTDMLCHGKREVGKASLAGLTLAAESVTARGSPILPGDTQPLLQGSSSDARYVNDTRVRMLAEKVEDASPPEAGHARLQGPCAGQNECAKHSSEQDIIAPMIQSIRRRIKVAEFQLAYTGYVARQALEHCTY